VLRSIGWTLRQRRYAALAAFMLVLALGCIAMGTFEIHRYREKRHDNAALVGNAHADAVALTRALVPVTGTGAVPSALAVRYRTIEATGRYLPAQQTYLRNQSQDGRSGYDVVTPLQTGGGVLLVLRGFLAASASGGVPAHVPAPPSGAVRIAGWLQPSATGGEERSGPSHNEIGSVVSAAQAARLGRPVFQAYATLRAHQPGGAGLQALSKPDLSNPSGGASAFQLLSYVVQWYVFALLALIAPFFFSRADARAAQQRFLGIDPGAAEIDSPALAPDGPLALPGARRGGVLATRARGRVARTGSSSPAWQRAERLADRYDVSLGPLTEAELAARSARRPVEDDFLRRDGRAGADAPPYRSPDDFHGAYNDYLWELALADGNLSARAPAADDARADVPDEPAPRIIDMVETSDDEDR
jgi:cytochrome oxidase assembly protein ShyY1